MSAITLSQGIRQNLLSLQDTAANLTTTQEHLATGKKINTAFDNPTSYFQSQSLNNRANDLSALLDQIGQGAQTLEAANNGLTSLTSLLEQALSAVQQAQQAQNNTAGSTTGTVNLTGNTLAAGNLLIAASGVTYTVSIAASASLSSIEAAINGTSGLGSSGAVSATDDGSGHLVLAASNPNTASRSPAPINRRSASPPPPSPEQAPRAPRCKATTTPCSPRSINWLETLPTTASTCSPEIICKCSSTRTGRAR
jgi:hypothetical protein